MVIKDYALPNHSGIGASSFLGIFGRIIQK